MKVLGERYSIFWPLNICPNIQQMPPIEATKELMNSPNYFFRIQVMEFILSCLDFRNNLLYCNCNLIVLLILFVKFYAFPIL